MNRDQIELMYGEYSRLDSDFLQQRDAQFEAIFKEKRWVSDRLNSRFQRSAAIQSIAVLGAIAIATASELGQMNPLLGSVGMAGLLVSWVKGASEMTQSKALPALAERVAQLYKDVVAYFDETAAFRDATGISFAPKKAVTPGDIAALEALAVERFLQTSAIDQAFDTGKITDNVRKNLQWKLHSAYSMLELNKDDLLYLSRFYAKLMSATPVLAGQAQLAKHLFGESHGESKERLESAGQFRP